MANTIDIKTSNSIGTIPDHVYFILKGSSGNDVVIGISDKNLSFHGGIKSILAL